MLPDGTAAVCDGGPLDATAAATAGPAVVHRDFARARLVRPIGANDPAGVDLAPDQLEAVAERRSAPA